MIFNMLAEEYVSTEVTIRLKCNTGVRGFTPSFKREMNFSMIVDLARLDGSASAAGRKD
jgi:hypothetical protein